MLNRLLIVLVVPTLYPLVKLFRRSWSLWILRVELFELVWTTNKVLSRVPDWVWVIAFPVYLVLKDTPYNLTVKDSFNFPLVVAVDLDWQWRVVSLAWQRVIGCLPELVW